MKKNLCTIYLVRHGETDWNLKGIIQGNTDIPLNKNGRIQAKELKKKLAKVNFDKVYSSDMKRAKETAEIIVEGSGLSVDTDVLLREGSFGKFEGKHFSFISKFEQDKKFRDKVFHGGYGGVEPIKSIKERIFKFLKNIVKQNINKQVLVVTHGGVIRNFLNEIGFAYNRLLPVGSIANSSYLKIRADGKRYAIDEFSGIEAG